MSNIVSIEEGTGAKKDQTLIVMRGKIRYLVTRPKSHNGDDPRYSVDIECTSEDLASLKALAAGKGKGLATKTLVKFKDPSGETDEDGEVKKVTFKDEEGHTYIKVSAKSKLPDGTDIALRVVDNKLNPITQAVGNGSTATVQIVAYPYTFQGKKGSGLRLKAVQVHNLIPYVGAGANNTGFTIEQDDSEELEQPTAKSKKTAMPKGKQALARDDDDDPFA